jgi:hypothetical protein
MNECEGKKVVKICWGLLDKHGVPVLYDNCPCIYETRRRAKNSVWENENEKIRKVRVTVEVL